MYAGVALLIKRSKSLQKGKVTGFNHPKFECKRGTISKYARTIGIHLNLGFQSVQYKIKTSDLPVVEAVPRSQGHRLILSISQVYDNY